MMPRKLPAPPTARPGSVTRDAGEILVICARTGKAYTVARVGTYRGAAAVHGWPWGTLEGIILSHGFVHGARGWAHPDAERAARKADAAAAVQLDALAPQTCNRCGRLHDGEGGARCRSCTERAERNRTHHLDALRRTCRELGIHDPAQLLPRGGRGSTK